MPIHIPNNAGIYPLIVSIFCGIQWTLVKLPSLGKVAPFLPCGAVSEKDSEASASNVSLVLGDDHDLI
ncbi:transmembrane protein, putative [Medicago truncatula]|uniref:Transmembrane protein, putative n=1 Tax=Medicago truncatula TaxID=3880 RepID=G7KNA0_MEDTR|nr:transmembrane protein, putative [Medicago truncatula]